MENSPVIKTLRLISCLLLLFNGAGAVYGGYLLMADPDGSQVQLPLSLLDHSPFRNYFMPGLILFSCNGILSILVLFASLFKAKHYVLLIMLQGCVLLGWIIMQVFMIQTISYLHFVLGGIALFLLIAGIGIKIQRLT
ncbi:MAG: hypothetical protein ACJ76F_06040 [Bacteroidia bacterium]